MIAVYLLVGITGFAVVKRAGAVTVPTATIFASTERPAVAASTDASSVELGLRFSVAVPGELTGIRFYKGAGNTGTHTGTLWSLAGKKLRSVTFTGETPSGWQEARFASPLRVKAGASYVVSYHAAVGRYSVTQSYPFRALTSPAFRVPATGAGVYRYGSTGFPKATYKGSNYWVDVVFQTTVAGSAAQTTGLASPNHPAAPAAATQASATPTRSPTPSIAVGTASPTGPTTRTDSTAATPSPTPSPTQTLSVPAPTSPAAVNNPAPVIPVSTGAFPDGSSTGVAAGTVLKAVSGDYTVSTAGAVVSGLDISGSLTVTAANVTVKNTRVRCIGVSSFCVSLDGKNTVFTDGEIGGGANGATFNNSAIGVWMGGSGGSATDHQVLRTNIHHVMQGPRMDGDCTLADSYVHDMSTASGVHSESIYFSAGSNMVLRHNTLGPGNTSNVWFDAQGGPAVSAVTITGNYLFATGLGGGQQPSWGIGLKTGAAANNTVTVTANVFDPGPWQVAPVTQSYPWATFTGNTYTNGTTVSP